MSAAPPPARGRGAPAGSARALPRGARLEERVSAQARRTPDACAIVDDGRRITYRELEERSSRLAEALAAHGVRPDDRVALLIPKSAEAVVAIFGVLKSAAVYVSLDVASPPARLARVLRALEPCWVLADSGQATLLEQCLQGLRAGGLYGVCWLGDAPGGFHPPVPTAPAAERAGDDPRGLAYIIFTSGSTGEPKGVPITHDSVIRFVEWANAHFGVGPDDRISLHASLHFDASVWDIFGALSCGAELHLVPARANLMPTLTAEYIRRSGVTQWHAVPSSLAALAGRDVVRHGDFPALRRLICGGELFPVASVRYWMERLPHVQVTNVYGATEATIVSSYHTVRTIPRADDPPLPIGTAVTGETLAVRDDALREVGPEVVGDLYIGGPGVSPGYWRDPAATAAAFMELPPGSGVRWYRTGDLARCDADGVFHFHGRADRQIKARGYRIELDEVAAALGRLSGLAESAVVAVAVGGFEGSRICAAYVPVPGVERTPAALRRELAASLPAYMLPVRWMALGALPRNRSGKIDHRAL
ncbi:MAG TPA: amino acid adenylation domain-containing protein, partial [Longimicrobium sp.]|nr:amino acid adenylation domain-containing protein [Longimicrobium sp.]